VGAAGFLLRSTIDSYWLAEYAANGSNYFGHAQFAPSEGPHLEPIARDERGWLRDFGFFAPILISALIFLRCARVTGVVRSRSFIERVPASHRPNWIDCMRTRRPSVSLCADSSLPSPAFTLWADRREWRIRTGPGGIVGSAIEKRPAESIRTAPLRQDQCSLPHRF
jgi:hypothetical protein